MLHYAVVFFVIALIAAVLGFGGIAAGAAGIAKILFFVFLVVAIATFFPRAPPKRLKEKTLNENQQNRSGSYRDTAGGVCPQRLRSGEEPGSSRQGYRCR